MSEARQKLIEGHLESLLSDMAKYAKRSPEGSAIHQAYHYLNKRQAHPDYAEARSKDLPIGSGEVESGHRSVLPSRLKKPGAWWTLQNAEHMAQLKITQVNGNRNQFRGNMAA